MPICWENPQFFQPRFFGRDETGPGDETRRRDFVGWGGGILGKTSDFTQLWGFTPNFVKLPKTRICLYISNKFDHISVMGVISPILWCSPPFLGVLQPFFGVYHF